LSYEQRRIKRPCQILKTLSDEVKETALWLRKFVWDLYPNSNELIYDNYNALAFGWSPTDRVGHVFCNIAVGRSTHNVHFGFYWAARSPIQKIVDWRGQSIPVFPRDR